MKHGYVAPIDRLTQENAEFRHVLYTAPSLQLVLMRLMPGEEIGMEMHEKNDQFLRIESGEGEILINGGSHQVRAGDCIIVPQGAEHNVINHSDSQPLRLYTIYAPPHHHDGTIHNTKAEAEESTEEYDGIPTE